MYKTDRTRTCFYCGCPAPVTLPEPGVGPRTADIIRSAESVELFRVTSQFDEKDFEALLKEKDVVAGLPILGRLTVDPSASQSLAAILLHRATYASANQMACLFRPGYVLRFTRKASYVHVVLCFSCNDVAFWPSRDLKERGAFISFNDTAGGRALFKAVTTLYPLERPRRLH